MKLTLANYRSLLVTYLRPQWGKVLLLTLLLFVSIGLQLVNPQIVRQFIDAARAGAPQTTLTNVALLFLAIALIQLQARGLTYHHAGGCGIENIDLQLRRGSFTVITGRIGAGKTTLLRVLLGLAPKIAGEILWNGEVVIDPSTFFVPPRSAYTPQAPRLFSQTLQENILLGLSTDQVDLAAALHQAVLTRDVADLPHGLETLVGPKGVKLSGGQVQRAACGCRAHVCPSGRITRL